jgi:hypothetical protein
MKSHSFVANLIPPSDTWFLLLSSVIIFVMNKIYINSQQLLSSVVFEMCFLN